VEAGASLASTSDAEREIGRVDALGARYLLLGQGLYPPALAELDDAPPLLIVKGDLQVALIVIMPAGLRIMRPRSQFGLNQAFVVSRSRHRVPTA
jgi:hypothetical protein